MAILSKNDIDSKNNIPLELGFDKWTSKYYDNKAFLQNALNYLLDDTEFLSLRNKKVQLAFLDKQKVAESVSSWQIKVFVYPLLLLILVMLSVLYFYRKKNIRKSIMQNYIGILALNQDFQEFIFDKKLSRITENCSLLTDFSKIYEEELLKIPFRTNLLDSFNVNEKCTQSFADFIVKI